MYRILFLFILSVSQLVAENSSKADSLPRQCLKCESCCDIPAEPTIAGYNAPGRINVCGSHDAYMTVSFIYWKIEENIFVAKFKANGTDANNDRSKFTTMNYDYKTGFKVGFGYNFEYDDWDAYIEYTRYHATNDISRSKPSWSQFMEPIYNRKTATTGDGIDFKLKLEYDFLDLDLSRWQYEGQKLLLKAFLGVHGAKLDQTITSVFHINSLNITNSSLYILKQWFIGPRIGFFYKWKIFNCFSLSSKGSTALLYQRFTKIFLKQDDLDTSPSGFPTLLTTERKRSSLNGLFELMIGFEYDKYFYYNKYHFNCLAGYDLHGLGSHLLPPGWIALHGLTLQGRLDF